MSRIKCKKIYVSKDVCGIYFTRDKKRREGAGCSDTYKSPLGEIYIMTNAKGEVVEIEILGNQPCQRSR